MIRTEAQAAPAPTPQSCCLSKRRVNRLARLLGERGPFPFLQMPRERDAISKVSCETLRSDSCSESGGRRVPGLCGRHRADGGAPWDQASAGCRHGPRGSPSSDLDTNALRGGLTLI